MEIDVKKERSTDEKKRHHQSRFLRSRSPAENGKTKKPKLESKVIKMEPKVKREPLDDDIDETKTLPDDKTVQNMLAQAQKTIEERKKQLNLMPSKINSIQAEKYMTESLMKNKRMEDLRSRINSQLPALLSYQSFQRQEGVPKPLILDDTGRTIDNLGHEIQLTHRMPTLKANIRAEKRAQFKRVVQETSQQVEEKDDESASYFDPRVTIKPAVRSKRGFKFHEKGEFETLANRLRAKARLEKLQQEISQAAKKTGISSAVKLAMVAPKVSETAESDVPIVEWWDSVILPGDSYVSDETEIKTDAIGNLVEHPIQLKAPGETEKAQFLKVYLTKKERKKLRRQNRKEMQREKQEKYRLGLEPAPEPKVKISNLMKVLGTSAVQDPTKMEAHVREQMAKRLKKHEDANLARKLTPEQRAAKKAKKLQDNTSTGIHVTVYRIKDLSQPAKKFKVEMNAKQLYMTGTVVLHKDINVVVVEGGAKQQKFFKRLMLQRTKWGEEKRVANVAESSTNDAGSAKNKCDLVWEGIVQKRSFGEIKFKQCPLEKLAREHFQRYGVEHYWDTAYSGAVLEHAEEST